MISPNLEKTLNYLKIKEILWPENFTEYCLRIKEYFIVYLPLPQKIIQKYKIKGIVELTKISWLFFKK